MCGECNWPDVPVKAIDEEEAKKTLPITDIIKCNTCDQVLVSGKGAIAIFGSGTSIACRKCGNKHTFGR